MEFTPFHVEKSSLTVTFFNEFFEVLEKPAIVNVTSSPDPIGTEALSTDLFIFKSTSLGVWYVLLSSPSTFNVFTIDLYPLRLNNESKVLSFGYVNVTVWLKVWFGSRFTSFHVKMPSFNSRLYSSKSPDVVIVILSPSIFHQSITFPFLSTGKISFTSTLVFSFPVFDMFKVYVTLWPSLISSELDVLLTPILYPSSPIFTVASAFCPLLFVTWFFTSIVFS